MPLVPSSAGPQRQSSATTAAQSPPHSSSVLVLMQQVREYQSSLRMSEARNEVLQEENQRLRQTISTLKQEAAAATHALNATSSAARESAASASPFAGAAVRSRAAAAAAAPAADGSAKPVLSRRSPTRNVEPLNDETIRRDALISELQRQLTDVLQRNTKLEKELHAQHSTLRSQFEAHVDRLEVELRRLRAGGGASMDRSAARASPPAAANFPSAASRYGVGDGMNSATPRGVRRDIL